MWFASCPQCALAVASTRDASVVLNASFSPSVGYRAARWVPRVALFIHAVSLPVAKIFSPSIGDQSSTIHVFNDFLTNCFSYFLLIHCFLIPFMFGSRLKTAEKVRPESVESSAETTPLLDNSRGRYDTLPFPLLSKCSICSSTQTISHKLIDYNNENPFHC